MCALRMVKEPKMEECYVVIVERPKGVTSIEMAAYIRDAINAWGGGYPPDDPLFTANWNNNVFVFSEEQLWQKIRR